GPDPFAGDPGGDPADGSRPSDGVPAVPYNPALETATEGGTGEPDVLTAAVDLPALFSPVDTDDAQGVPADGLIEYLRETDPAVLRDESAAGLATLAYADGNVFEVKTLADGKTLVTMTYRFPTGQKSRRGDMTYDEKTEKPRAFAAFEYLLPEYAETAENDFASMRHWEEVYCRAYGLAEADWSAFVRSRYYGARYCRMSVTRDTVTVTLYPAGYVDDSGDFAANGSYREFFTYPIR
ncbi:MAG: hypothetical protein IKX91_02265, partial [Firmicutes bacterium]|nr:hypothetical protein [Bacillota bacterium]